MLLFANVVLCIVAAMAVFMVNGTGTLTLDHFCLLALVILTLATAVLLKTPDLLHNKVLFWFSVFPVVFISCHPIFTDILSQRSL